MFICSNQNKKSVTYVGYTNNFQNRIRLHNQEKVQNLLEVVNGS